MTSATALAVRDETFEQVNDGWRALLRRLPEPIPFVTPAWQRLWLDHFRGDRQCRVLAARDNGDLAGVAPLLVDGASAEFVGHYSICDYMDVACAPGVERGFWSAVLQRLAADGITRLDLRGIVETSPTLEAVPEGASVAGYSVERQQEALSPGVNLPGSWDEYLGNLSKKDRHEMRRKLRRLEHGGGNVELRVVTETAEADTMLDTLFHLMRVSSHHKEEFLDRPGMQDFFRAMTSTMAREGMLRFYFLTFDGQAVASVLNFDVGGRLYMYNSGYDPAYAHYAVGLMSKVLLIRDAIENGRSCVDFLRGDESYKYDLGGKDRTVYRLVLTR